MHRICVALAVTGLAGSLLSLVSLNSFAEESAPPPLKLRKIYFLIHPLTYVPECAHSYGNKERYRAWRDFENPVRRRYHEAIDKMAEDEALVIYPTLYPTKDDPHAQELIDIEVMARRKLGRRLVLCTYPTTSAEFVKLADAQGLTYDLQTVDTESWGESFDGCVAKYCSRFTTELGLGKPMAQNFAMCVPDAVWLLKARFIEKVTLRSKIRFYLFESEEGRPMAVFFEPYLLPAGASPRSVDIPLDPSKGEIWRRDYTTGSEEPIIVTNIATPDGMGVRLPVTSWWTKPIQMYPYLFGKDVDLATFQAALMQAKLVE